MKNYVKVFMLLILVGVIIGCAKTPTCTVTKQTKTELVDSQEVEEYRTEIKYELAGTPSLDGKYKLTNYVKIGKVSVKNTDTETGEFVVSQTVDTLEDAPETKQTRKTIKAGETLLFEEEFDVDVGEDTEHTYKVIPESVVKTRTKIVKKPVTIEYNQTTCS